MRAVLTGGTGFVGANLARRLLRDGHEVHLLARPGHASWRIEDIRADIHLHEIRLTDFDALCALIGRIRPEWIFHLAAHGAYSHQTDARQIAETNVLCTVNLLEACRSVGFGAFIHAGSSSEYGFKDHAPAETETLEPNSAYAAMKAAATLYCQHWATSQGLAISTLRLYSIYGPWEEPGRLMPTLIARGLRGEWPPLVNPDIARDFVFTEDACDAFVGLAEAHGRRRLPGAIYNLGSGAQTTLRELVDVARRVLRNPAPPLWGTMPSRVWDTTCWVADSRRIQEALGWRPRHDLETGFRAMARWFEDHPELRPKYEGASR